MMKKILIFFSLFIYSLNQYELNIEEGTKSFIIQKETLYTFTFKAINSGNYIIIFPDHFELKEATGELHEDVDINSFFSLVYAQNFVKGNIVKVEYPKLKIFSETTNIKIRIEKIDAYFKLMTIFNPIIFTMAVNDCQKPIYIFAYNNQPDNSESFYTFHGKVHSGEFTGSYRKTEFDPDYPMDKDFTELTISSATKLPYQFNLNIIKLQCKEPGIISIYMERIHFYDAFDDIGLCAHYSPMTYVETFYKYQLPAKGYYQGFNLVGKTSIDFSKIGGNSYSSDFFTELTLPSSLKTGSYDISFNNLNFVTMTLTNFNLGESTSQVARENEKILIMKENILIIPLSIVTDKKKIKITSTVDGFYWDYQYSQTPDVNYLPKLSYESKHFQKGKTVYIDNPYIYKKIQTNYNWFISIIHYNDEGAIVYYEYCSENDDNNKDNDDGSNYTWLWILLSILFIAIIIFVAWIFYRKKKLNSSVENLIKDSPDQKIM